MRPNVSRQRHSPRAAGFTIIELMLVVGILGMLASMAIMGFEAMQRKSKQVERRVAMSNLALQARHLFSAPKTGYWSSDSWNPAPPYTFTKKEFDPSLGRWRELDWQPSGHTYYHYYVFGDSTPPTPYFYIYALRGHDDFSYAYVREYWTFQRGNWVLHDRYLYPSNFAEEDI